MSVSFRHMGKDRMIYIEETVHFFDMHMGKGRGKNYADYDRTTVKDKGVAAIKPVFMRVL